MIAEPEFICCNCGATIQDIEALDDLMCCPECGSADVDLFIGVEKLADVTK